MLSHAVILVALSLLTLRPAGTAARDGMRRERAATRVSAMQLQESSGETPARPQPDEARKQLPEDAAATPIRQSTEESARAKPDEARKRLPEDAAVTPIRQSTEESARTQPDEARKRLPENAAATPIRQSTEESAWTQQRQQRQPRKGTLPPDSLVVRRDTIPEPRESERNRKLYDSISTKSGRRAVPRMLYRLLFLTPRPDTTGGNQVRDESRRYAAYEGRRISSVRIVRKPVFDEERNWLERAANATHIQTRERAIRRDLLFHPGDAIDPQILVRNQQLLRERSYVSDASIELQPDPEDSTRMEVTVIVRDSWTINVDLEFRSEGRTTAALSDDNILGSGNKLDLKTFFNRNNFDYGGNLIRYRIPNVLGSFYEADLSAGRDFQESEISLSLDKKFILPDDYALGASFGRVKERYYRVDLDTTDLVRSTSLDLWGGRSWEQKSIRSSLFVTGRYLYEKYDLRPEVGPDLNPAFHNYNNILAGIGLYREQFYTANMIYGFGTREYLAAGYKAEFTTGYSWGEFDDLMYFGLSCKAGGFTEAGYLMGGWSLGSYIDLADGSWKRSGVDIDLRWFSRLFVFRRNRIRQFLGIDYTQGWNRSRGSDEVLRFTRTDGPRALLEEVAGINRAALNTETIVFTPYQPWGFRIAVYGFADAGVLGPHANMFRNAFFATFGIGVRIKNERLIFSAIQLQIGVAVGKEGLVDTRWFEASNQPRLTQYRYRPSQPEPVEFK